jgi:hypothetical protein
MKFIRFVAPLLVLSAACLGCGGNSNEVIIPENPAALPTEPLQGGELGGESENSDSPPPLTVD